jgi:hypothetical protein
MYRRRQTYETDSDAGWEYSALSKPAAQREKRATRKEAQVLL